MEAIATSIGYGIVGGLIAVVLLLLMLLISDKLRRH